MYSIKGANPLARSSRTRPLATSLKLKPFQRRFVAAAASASFDTACLSVPRGNGKSWLAAHLLERCLTPGDALHVEAAEYLLCAASLEQARIVFRFLRSALEPTGYYRFLDASTRLGITDKRTGTRLRVLSSNGKTAMGIVGTPLLVADEPGSWEVNGGALMHDAITTAQGKPGSPLKVVYIGTLAPAQSGWWHQLIQRGTHGSTYVQVLQGQRDKWAQWREIARCNPLAAVDDAFKAKLREERDDARGDTRLKARFLSYRLNVPSADESTVLLSVDDWKRMCARPVAPHQGAPMVGVDLGGGRAWSAAVAVWRTGRVEALAVCPGIPTLAEQEKADRVPSGTYQKLVELGVLHVAEGLRVQTVNQLVELVSASWGVGGIVADLFHLNRLRDEVGGRWPLQHRRARWSEATEDIAALRKLALDGPLSVELASRELLAESLAAAVVKNDEQGSCRLIKRDPSNNTGRDDVAAALVLAAGVLARTPTVPRRAPRFSMA